MKAHFLFSSPNRPNVFSLTKVVYVSADQFRTRRKKSLSKLSFTERGGLKYPKIFVD